MIQLLMKCAVALALAVLSTQSTAQTYYLKAQTTGVTNPSTPAHYAVTLSIVTSVPSGAKVLIFKESSVAPSYYANSSYLYSGLTALYMVGVPSKMKIIRRSDGVVLGTIDATTTYTISTAGGGAGFLMADGTVISSGPHYDGSNVYSMMGWAGGGSLYSAVGPNACGSSYGTVYQGYKNGTIYNPISGVCGYPQQANAQVDTSFLVGY